MSAFLKDLKFFSVSFINLVILLTV
jgi:hypothetical protein